MADVELWKQVEAFRELLGRGNSLLSEVAVASCKAEEALRELSAEKQVLDADRAAIVKEREQFESERAQWRAEADASAARMEEQQAALSKAQEQLQAVSQELDQARVAHEQAVSRTNELISRMGDMSQRQVSMQSEMEQLTKQAAANTQTAEQKQAADAGSSDLQIRLEAMQRELDYTRQTLQQERERRNRAISLIKPNQVTTPASQPSTPSR